VKKKQFAVIGMGRFGSSVAKTLYEMHYEVLAIDRDESRTEEVAETVTHTVTADSTDEDAMRAIGIRNFDVAVVAIGQDIQASILTTLILKEMGVPTIVAKAQNELHGKVLSKIGADEVIYPERDMGMRVAHRLISPSILDHIELAGDYGIVDLKAGPAMIGKNLRQLDIRNKYGCNVMGIRSKDGAMNISPSAEDLIREGDVLVVVGKNEDLYRFERAFSREENGHA